MSAPAAKRPRAVLVGAGMGLAIVAALFLLYLPSVTGDVFRRWELALYDQRLHWFPKPEQASDEFVVLKIDDATVRRLELEKVPWPPPRWFYGELVTALEALEPRAIVFDWVFQDQRDGITYDTKSDPFAEVSAENAQAGGVEYSRAAAKQMHAAGNVVQGLYAMNLDGTEEQIRLTVGWNPRLVPYFEARIPDVRGAADIPAFPATPGFRAVLRYPEASMLVGARALGFVNHQHAIDLDGSTRRFQPFVRVDGQVVTDLATSALVVAVSGSAAMPEWPYTAPPPADAWPPLAAIERTERGARVGGWEIPLDRNGDAWIRWRGHWETNPLLSRRTRSAIEIWDNRDALLLGEEVGFDKSFYEGKVILIGFTGQGEGSDYVGTPFGPQPGVFRHAAILDTILTQDFPRGLPDSVDWLLAALLASVSGAFVLSRAGAKTRLSGNTVLQVVRLSGLGILPMAIFLFVALMLFYGVGQSQTTIVEMVPPVVASGGTVPLVVFLGIAWAQAGERRARKMAVRALGPALVKQVEAGGGELRMGGERVPLTLYFSDIAGFTTISEKLQPEELINILNEYLTRVSEILHDGHGATIDKYIGDAVMAFWGAPIPQPDGPVRACLAALDVMKAIDLYSAELVAQGLSPLKTRIGINTGPAVAGGVGHVRDAEDGKFSYTAMGDTVNLASRLEGANKAYGTTCMLGPETYEQAKHAILARELDLVRVKGKTIPVRVYELMGKAGDELPEKREIKRRYEAALVRFRSREFEAARAEFLALLNEFGDPPSKTLAAACEELMKNPPPGDWDGSNELHEK